MRTVNKVILIGNIAKDPLVRTTTGGAKSALFVVATNRVYKDKTGAVQSEAEFSNCIAWGPLADRCDQFLRKGKLVYVEGRLKTRTKDLEDGTRLHRTEIVVMNLIFLSKREDAPGYEDMAPETAPPEHADILDVDMEEENVF
jgi:single-strand DNA-binding protein